MRQAKPRQSQSCQGNVISSIFHANILGGRPLITSVVARGRLRPRFSIKCYYSDMTLIDVSWVFYFQVPISFRLQSDHALCVKAIRPI